MVYFTDVLRELRPAPLPSFEVRFETPPGDQAQVDFAQFQLQFTDEPAITRIVWLFSFVLGFSRLIWEALAKSISQLPRLVSRDHSHDLSKRRS